MIPCDPQIMLLIRLGIHKCIGLLCHRVMDMHLHVCNTMGPDICVSMHQILHLPFL